MFSISGFLHYILSGVHLTWRMRRHFPRCQWVLTLVFLQIPEGDWFCQDCRPKETRRSYRRRPVVQESEDEEEEADSNDEEEEDEEEESSEEESGEESEEESEDGSEQEEETGE